MPTREFAFKTIFCQCGAKIKKIDDECDTVGCPRSNMPPQDFSGTLCLYPDGLNRPTFFAYRIR